MVYIELYDPAKLCVGCVPERTSDLYRHGKELGDGTDPQRQTSLESFLDTICGSARGRAYHADPLCSLNQVEMNHILKGGS